MSGLVQEAGPCRFWVGQKRGSVRKYKGISLRELFLHLSEMCSTQCREYLSSSGFIIIIIKSSHKSILLLPQCLTACIFLTSVGKDGIISISKSHFFFFSRRVNSPDRSLQLHRGFHSVGKSPKFQHFLPPLHLNQHCWGGGALKPLAHRAVHLNYSQYLDGSTLKPMEKSGNEPL